MVAWDAVERVEGRDPRPFSGRDDGTAPKRRWPKGCAEEYDFEKSRVPLSTRDLRGLWWATRVRGGRGVTVKRLAGPGR